MQGRGLRHERLSNTRSIGNVRYLDRRQANCDGGDRYKENDCEKGRHREGILDKEREQEKHWNQRDRHGGDNQMDRRVRARSRSQSRDDSDDDNPRRRR
jgi:cleavage and polyadenylation specificity factor subunit 6/7